MKILILILIPICLMSCKKEIQENFSGPKGLYLVLVNKNGDNLLNPTTKNFIDFDNIKKFHLIEGQYIEQYYSHLDNPKGCKIFDSEYPLGNIFATSLNENFNDKGQSITVIDWGNGDTDTIVATINPQTNLPYSEFWYNDISMKDLEEKTYGDENYYYEIFKNY